MSSTGDLQTVPKRGCRLIASVSKIAGGRQRFEILHRIGRGNMGEIDGKPFIAMEYLEGTTLRKHKVREVKEALAIAAEIAEALEVAHACGIVHRDLKPANIMLTVQGHVKIMDFGPAKRIGLQGIPGAQEETPSGLPLHEVAVGTLPYISPERLRCDKVDQRSDIFSFGVILYEMLTGVNPFRRGASAETKEEPIEARRKPMVGPRSLARVGRRIALLALAVLAVALAADYYFRRQELEKAEPLVDLLVDWPGRESDA